MDRYRHEYKYRIDRIEEEILLMRARGALDRDSHAGKDGTYYVRSLYFDDYGDSCLLDNEDGVDPRCKFRMRYYNDDIGYIRLERKSKRRGMCRKSTCLLTTEECRKLMRGIIPEVRPDMPEDKQKMFLEMELRSLIPKVIVSFERAAFVWPMGEVRITFDRQITSSGDIEQFLAGNYPMRPVLSEGRGILEIKWDEALPLYLKNLMQLDSLQWDGCSKYYMCRLCHL
mgnify:CR=1 FL=1|jgi:hypothetical protein